MDTTTILAYTKDISQILAFLGAFVFFMWKWVTGYLLINLSLTLSARRQSTQEPAQHDLIVSIKLDKGAHATLNLHELRVRAIALGSEESAMTGDDVIVFKDERVRGIENGNPGNRNYLKLPPGEATCLSHCLRLDATTSYSVEVVASGNRAPFGPQGHWIATTITVPADVGTAA